MPGDVSATSISCSSRSICTAQTAFGIGEHAAGGFKML
jgi:hypothetical protein